MATSAHVTTQQQVEAANASGRAPVVFVHGLWLLPNSWDKWAAVFEEAGYAAITADWPGDPDSVEEAKANPEVFANVSIGEVADHVQSHIGELERKPALIGHSFGGLLVQILAGRGLSAATVSISPAPFRGVLPLPFSALRVASVALRNPLNKHRRAVPLSFEQFRFGFANVADEDEAHRLYDEYAVPTSGEPLFQAAAANFVLHSQAAVDTGNETRGPLLLISGTADHTVPDVVTSSTFKKYRDSTAVTHLKKFEGRGHSLTIDHGWPDVADEVLTWLRGCGI
jgi:pimeloyl-ACP methyl ester carboxylesterase